MKNKPASEGFCFQLMQGLSGSLKSLKFDKTELKTFQGHNSSLMV